MIVIDRRGGNAGSLSVLPRNPSWAQANKLFGIGIEKSHGENAVPAGGWYWKFVGVSINEGVVIYRAAALDAFGNPAPGIRIVRHWPGAPVLPNDPDIYSNRGIAGITESGGDKFGAVEFVYSGSSYYNEHGSGPDSFWVVSPSPDGRYLSDMAHNFGWLAAWNHFNPSPIFQATQSSGEPPEEEEPPVTLTLEERVELLESKMADVLAYIGPVR
jgi:hypothetical protein